MPTSQNGQELDQFFDRPDHKDRVGKQRSETGVGKKISIVPEIEQIQHVVCFQPQPARRDAEQMGHDEVKHWFGTEPILVQVTGAPPPLRIYSNPIQIARPDSSCRRQLQATETKQIQRKKTVIKG